MKAIIYHNNSNLGQIILVVWGKGLLDADTIFKQKFGKDVTKLPHIGAEIIM